MGDKKASLWKRNLAVVVGATAAVAVTVAGCSSDGGTSAEGTTPPAGSAASATPTTAEPSPPPPPASAEPTAAPASAPAQQDGGAPEGTEGTEGTDMRDQATEQLKESLAADEAHWEGDTLIATMAWGTADSAGMDTVCRGADMLLEQWGTATLNFPDGTTRDCGA
ncbi:MAG: hypothetical protein L0H59_10485 [Tomitella sp.]|nr:hypothetical protein [Tomitella sp.]